MEVVKYLVEVIKWEESPWESYADLNANMSFALALSPPDDEEPAYSYFAVQPLLKITNGGNHPVFVGETKSSVRLTNKGVAPPADVLYEIIVEATREFGKIFMERTKDNPHIHHAIPKPLFKNLQGIIDDCLLAAYPDTVK